jgi:hypothetical protein
MPAGRPPIPIEIRFWPKVDRRSPDECWPWKGAEHGNGYGGISVLGKSVPAHRVAYALANGEPPGEMFVLHRCDNPRCCNPDHLFLGDHAANMEDMVYKGRSKALLKPEEAIAARALSDVYGWTPARIARRFKVQKWVIHQLLAKKTYRHVGADLTLADFYDNP